MPWQSKPSCRRAAAGARPARSRRSRTGWRRSRKCAQPPVSPTGQSLHSEGSAVAVRSRLAGERRRGDFAVRDFALVGDAVESARSHRSHQPGRACTAWAGRRYGRSLLARCAGQLRGAIRGRAVHLSTSDHHQGRCERKSRLHSHSLRRVSGILLNRVFGGMNSNCRATHLICEYPRSGSKNGSGVSRLLLLSMLSTLVSSGETSTPVKLESIIRGEIESRFSSFFIFAARRAFE